MSQKNTLPSFTPILIVGAGPAGATASLTLSHLGIEHLIIDKAIFPRDKICGDGLDLKIPRIFRHLNRPEWTEELLNTPDIFLPAWGVRMVAPNGRTTDNIYTPLAGTKNYPPFVTAKRQDFDNFLLNKITSPYAHLRTGASLEALRRTPQGWEADILYQNQLQTVCCQLLMAADGDHSTILSHLQQRKIDRVHYASSLRVYYKNVAGLHPQNLIEFHFRKELPMGYFWIFPLPNGQANVGLGIQSRIAADRDINLRSLLDKLLFHTPDISHRFEQAQALEPVKGWGIPLASRRRTCVGDHYMLLGDAASLVNPLNGEGIGTAMLSGYIAAHYAQKAILNKSFTAQMLSGYEQDMSLRLADEVKAYNMALRFNHKRWYFPTLNTLFALDIPNRWIKKSMHQWHNTAFEQEIKLRFLNQ